MRRDLVAVTTILWLLVATGQARAQTPSTCAGIADYSDELVLSAFALESIIDVGGGVSEVQISAIVTNLDVGEFATVTPQFDFSDSPHGILADPPVVPMEFSDVSPEGSAASSTSMVLRLPPANVGALLVDLEAGTVPVVVHADETMHLADGVVLRYWGQHDDDLYDAQAGVFITPPGEAPGVLGGFELGDEHYVLEDPERYEVQNVPEALRNGRISSVHVLEGEDEWTWIFSLADTANDVLPSVVDSGSFCTTSAHHIDWPVLASRLDELDGMQQSDEARDSHVQPIRFNNVSFFDGAVILSGQVQGHLIKPTLQIRFRDGDVVARAGFDTDLSFTGRIKAEGEVTSGPDEDTLWELCFGLPPIVIGPVKISLSIELEHILGTYAMLRAGAIMAVQKTFSGGYVVGYDGRKPEGERNFSRSSYNPTPIDFTPPYLTDDTHAVGQLWTTLRTALKVGSTSPECDLGWIGEAYMNATGVVQLDVDPQTDPWWMMSHDAWANAGLELEPFGLNITRHETEIDFFPTEEVLIPETEEEGEEEEGGEPMAGLAFAPTNAPTMVVGARNSGTDHRWSVAIDKLGVVDNITRSAIAALPDSSVVVISRGQLTFHNELVKLDRHGAFLWSRRYADARRPEQVLGLPDGSIVVGGQSSVAPQGFWLAKHDSDGNLLWNREYDVRDPVAANEGCRLRDLAYVEESPGVYGFIVAGIHRRLNITQNEGCAARIEADGDLLWAKIYDHDREQEFYGVTPTADGGFVFVGNTWLGADAFSTNSPMVVKVDAQGDVVWAKSIPIEIRPGRFNAVVESSTGTLFMAGFGGLIVNRTGALLVGRIDADGENVRHAMYWQDEAWENRLNFESWIDTDGGHTAWDEALDIALAPGGFVVVGHTGLDNNVDNVPAAWVFKGNAGLGTEWFTTLDGMRDDILDSVAPIKGGFLVSGRSRSLLPIGTGDTEYSLWASKLPYEGTIDFLPQTYLISRYIEPAIRYSSADPDVIPDAGPSIDHPLVVSDGNVVSVAPIANLLVTPPNYCVTLLTATGHVSLLDQCDQDSDGDGVLDSVDGCPGDPNKSEPGSCGCGFADVDTDSDGTFDCVDECPDDPDKTDTGECGCFELEGDGDADGTPDCHDECDSDPNKVEAGLCGCGITDADTDADGTPDCTDLCPSDPAKTSPGICDCGTPDIDQDLDGTFNCDDGCPLDADKTEPGDCGCDVAETDTDADGTPDCNDLCVDDPFKTDPGVCECGRLDTDQDLDGTLDCLDGCPLDAAKILAGACGCGVADTDTDADGTPDCTDACASDPAKTAPGICGCGTADTDTDADGMPDCNDGCVDDPAKTEPGACGCGSPEQPGCNDVVVVLTPQWDSFVAIENRNGNEGAAARLRVRGIGARSLLRFDPVEIEAAVAGGALLGATLEVTISNRARGFGANAMRSIDVHRVTQDPWIEGNGATYRTSPASRGSGTGVTWVCPIDEQIANNRTNCRGGVRWNMGIGFPVIPNPWNPAATASQPLARRQNGTMEFDVTDDVQLWLDDTPNFGWVLKLGGSFFPFGDVSFWSREGRNPPTLKLDVAPSAP